MKTKREINWSLRKIEGAIDRMIDLQDEGFGCDNVSRILERLNDLHSKLEMELQP